MPHGHSLFHKGVRMRCELHCPACGRHTIDFESYKSMVILAPNLALMQYICPGCKVNLSATVKLPFELQHKLHQEKVHAETDGASSSIIEHEMDAGDKRAPIILDKSKLSYAATLIMEGKDQSINVSMPIKSCIVDQKEALEDFRHQIESIETVDDMIREIGSGQGKESRDM